MIQSLKGVSVLMVDDSADNQDFISHFLKFTGAKILIANNGVEAVDIALKTNPDLILMDIQLPEISGLEVTKWLKEDDDLAAIPVVAVTAFAMKGDEERIRRGGCEAYISKPISVATFIDTVRRFVGEA